MLRPGLVIAALCAVTAPLEDFRRTVGPLSLPGRSFTVVLEGKRLPGAADPDFGETIVALEIRGQDGKSHYRRKLPYRAAGNRFEETWAVGARVLEGKRGSGLLLTYGVLPSAPLGGQSWQLFALAGGRLVPLSKPLATEGNLVGPTFDPNLQADVLEFRVWTGNFFAIVPLRVDWLAGRIAPAWGCLRMTARGPVTRCQYRVEAERRPRAELTFIRLFSQPEETGIPAHVVVKQDSRVECLAAEAALVWEEGAEEIMLGVAEDVWLKLRVDGREGWIHTEEDLHAVGLPSAG